MSPGGVSDGLTQTVMKNRIPQGHLKDEDTDRQRKSEGDRASWENKQYEIMGLSVMHHSAAATLAVFI